MTSDAEEALDLFLDTHHFDHLEAYERLAGYVSRVTWLLRDRGWLPKA